MTNKKVPAVRNPFTRKTMQLERTPLGIWIPIDNEKIDRRLVHKTSFTASQKASISEVSSNSVYEEEHYSPREALYEHADDHDWYELEHAEHEEALSEYSLSKPDWGISGNKHDSNPLRDSIYLRDSPFDDVYGLTFSTTHAHREEQHPHSKRGDSTPWPMLSEILNTSSSPAVGVRYTKETPPPGYSNIGWEFCKDPKDRKESDATTITTFPGSLTSFVPVLAPKADRKVKKKIKEQTVYGNSVAAESWPSFSGVSKFIDKQKATYRSGPKGDGHILWSAIQKLRKARSNVMESLQKDRVLGTILEVDANLGNPLTEATPKSPPRRPDPASPLGIIRSPTSLFPITTTPPSHPTTQLAASLSQTSLHIEKTKVSSSNSSSSFSIPIGASASVQFDAQEITVGGSNTLPSVPKLKPAPRTRESLKRAALAKRGLPPPPMLPAPKRAALGAVIITTPLDVRETPQSSISLIPVDPVGTVISTATPEENNKEKVERVATINDWSSDRHQKKKKNHSWLVKAWESFF